jgi:hypothetical protein
MDQSVDTVCVERRGSFEQLVNDYTQRPKVDRVVVGQFLHQLWCHVKWGTLDRSQDDCVGGH